MTPATTLNHAQPASNPPSPDSRLRDSRLAPLDPDTESQILDLFIAGQMELSTIAAMNNITFTQLIDFLESPKIVERLDDIQRLCERRAAIMAAEARCVALARLRTIAEHQPEAGFTPPKLFTRELETTRKAAAQLLRLNPPVRGEVSGAAGRGGLPASSLNPRSRSGLAGGTEFCATEFGFANSVRRLTRSHRLPMTEVGGTQSRGDTEVTLSVPW